jgi:hypothetical protein
MDQSLEGFGPPLLLVPTALGESGGGEAEEENGDEKRRASHGLCFPRSVKAVIAEARRFAQASSGALAIVVILPRTSKMGGNSGSGDCVGFVSSRKRRSFDQS